MSGKQRLNFRRSKLRLIPLPKQLDTVYRNRAYAFEVIIGIIIRTVPFPKESILGLRGARNR